MIIFRNSLGYRTTTALLLTALLPLAASGEEAAAISWQNTVGTHYRLDNQSWLGTTRDLPGQGNVGFLPDVTDLAPKNIEPTIGRFSGEPRVYNFDGRTVRPGATATPPSADINGLAQADTATLDADGRDARERERASRRSKRPPQPKDFIQAALDAESAGIDLLWHTGQVSIYSSPANVNYLMAKQGAYFKDTLYALYQKANSGPLAHRKTTLYWEIGNEVNSSQRFSLRDLTDGQYVEGHPGHAQDYVEYYLAPAIEALRTAAKEISGDPHQVKILMGSVSGIVKAENQHFLDLVLNHTIVGTHAPSLAGRKVYEVIDTATIHYSIGDRFILQSIYDQWIGSGKVDSLWSTEELGTRGHGDYTTTLVSIRWLNFSLSNAWTGGQPGRVIFWGDKGVRHPADPTGGADMLREIGSVLRDYPLHRADDQVKIGMRADFEWYAFAAGTPEAPHAFAIYLKPYQTTQPALTGISIELPPGLPPLSRKQVRVQGLVPTIGKATRSLSLDYTVEAHGLKIDFDPHWEMPVDESLMLLIELTPTPDSK